MRPLAEGTWVVTGAASGLGREAALQLSARGASLSLWDRDEVGLAATAARVKSRHHCIAVNVADAEAVRRAATRSLESIGRCAHVLHCAGILRMGGALQVPPADYAQMMQVNFLGSVHVAQALLPQLRAAAGRSTLTFVSSVAGLRGFPGLAGYAASKFAVRGFAEALRDELFVEGDNVDVRVLCPPPVNTAMVRAFARLPPIYRLSPTFAADAIVRSALAAIEEKRSWLLLHDLRSRALWRLQQWAPGLLGHIVRRVGSEKQAPVPTPPDGESRARR